MEFHHTPACQTIHREGTQGFQDTAGSCAIMIQLMNDIEEMVFNLAPQFERYEGQVRFTQGLDDDSQEIVDDPSTTGEVEASYAGDNGDELARSGSAAEPEPGPAG